jgi:hypothetical protein
MYRCAGDWELYDTRKQRDGFSFVISCRSPVQWPINVYLARPVLDSFLFSFALAVGLTPQLLPAIISISQCFLRDRLYKPD